MIHIIAMTGGVRYSIAGVLHTEAEALALDLSPSASVVDPGHLCLVACSRSGPLEPYGADGCTCAPIDGPLDIWRLADACTYHGGDS